MSFQKYIFSLLKSRWWMFSLILYQHRETAVATKTNNRKHIIVNQLINRLRTLWMFFFVKLKRNTKLESWCSVREYAEPYSFILSLKNQQISFGKKWTLGRWQILGDGKWTFKEVLSVSVVLTNRKIVSTLTVYSLPFPFFLITIWLGFFLGQNNNWLFCEYLLSSSSSLLANVSVLSKLVKFLHHINPTRQYPACVLSTHIENATFAGKPARSYIFFIYLFLSFILRQDGTKLIQNWVPTLSKMSTCVSLSLLANFFTHINLPSPCLCQNI